MNRFWLFGILVMASVSGILVLVPQIAISQTTVFSDNFSGLVSSGSLPLSTSGNSFALTSTSPAGNYTFYTSAGSNNQVNVSSQILVIGTNGSNQSAHEGITYPLANFSSPFNTTLSSNSGLVTWTFNMRKTNATNNPYWTNSTGRYVTTVLCASSADLTSSSCTGYMVAQTSTTTYSLCRFSKGIISTNSADYTAIIGPTTALSATANWASIKVTYNPADNKWSFYCRDDGSTASVDPSTVSTQVGTATSDNTYTGTAMSTFGFFVRKTTSNSDDFSFDNFNVTVTPTATPTITLSSPSPSVATANIAQATSKNLIYKFNTTITTSAAQISQVNFTSAGTYVAADISKFQLWYKNNSDDFSTATQIGSDITTSLGTGSHSFGSLSQSIASGTTGYFYVTADVAGGATINNKINVPAIATTDLTFVSGNKSGTAYDGQDQTIVAGVSNINLSEIGTIEAGNMLIGSANNILYNFKLAVSSVANTLTQVNIPNTGSHDANDLANLKLWYNSTNNGPGSGATLIKTISSPSNSSTQTFGSLTQTIGIGATGYFWVTADINTTVGGGTPGNTITVTPALSFAYLSFSGSVNPTTGTISAGGTKTIVDYSNVTLSEINTVAAASILQNSTNNILYNFQLAVATQSATLTQVTLPNNGTYTSSDLTNLKLWYNSTNNFGTATTIKTLTGLSNITPQTFGSLSQTINTGSTGYFWITTDVAGAATIGRTIAVNSALSFSNLSFSATVNQFTGTINNASTQTVAAGVSNINLSGISTVAAGNILVNTTNNILYNFQLAVTSVATTLTQVSFPNSGTYDANDLSNLKLWYNSSNNGPGSGATALSTISTPSNLSSQTFAGLSQAIAIGATGYFWITADVNSIAAGGTLGNTIAVTPALSFANLSFVNNINATTGSINPGGTKTIIGYADITLSEINTVVAANIAQNTTNNILYNFKLDVSSQNATLTQVVLPNSGNYSGTDLTNFKLWYNSNNNFAGATSIKTLTGITNNATQTFSGLSQLINAGNAGYFWITTDVAAAATVGRTITVNSALSFSNLVFTTTVNQFTGLINSGGTQTIAAGVSNVTLSGISTVGAGNIFRGVANNILYNFQLSVTGVATTLNQVVTTNTGTYASGDFSNLKLWYNSSNNFGTAINIATISSPSNNATQTFTSFSQTIAAGTTGYFWITGDVASGAIPNNNIAITPAFNFGNLTFGNTVNATLGSIGAASTQTILPATLPSYYFRSRKTGDWSTTNSWESSSDNVSWYEASLSPSSSANTITIQAGHIIAVTSAANADQMNIAASGQVTVNNGVTFTIANGPGTDLTVDGYLKNSGNITATGTLIFNSGSTYEHSQDLGTIPTAAWDVNSTMYVTGLTSGNTGAMSGLGQAFGNVTFLLNTGAAVELNSALQTINGNLRLNGTGSGSLRFVDGTITTIYVGGNLEVSAGNYIGARSTKDLTLSITGNMKITGGSFYLSNSGSNSAITTGGNFEVSGGSFYGGDNSNSNPMITTVGNCIITGGTVVMQNSSGTSKLIVGNDFSISGGSYLQQNGNNLGELVVGHDFTANGGIFSMQSSSYSNTISIGNDFNLQTGGVFRLAESSSSQKGYRVRIGGNVNMTGGTFGGSYSNPSAAGGGVISFILGGGTNATPTFTLSGSVVLPGTFPISYIVEAGKTVSWNNSVTIGNSRTFACAGGNIQLANGISITVPGATNPAAGSVQGGYLDCNTTSVFSGGGDFYLLGSVPGTNTTANTSTGNPLLTSVVSTANIYPGMSVTGAGIPAGTYIVSIANGSSVMMSEAATSSGSVSISVNSSRGTLKTGNVLGIMALGTNTGSVQTTRVRSFSTSANYEYNNATTAQNSGTGLPAIVNDLTINNGANPASTNGVTLNNSAGTAVDGILYLIDGVMTTSSVLPITINNTSASAVVRTSTSDETYVNGPIRRFVLSGSTLEYLFPTGKNTGLVSRYKPATFIPVNNTGGRFDAEYMRTDPPQVSGPDYFLSFLTGIDKLEYWQFDRASGTTSGKLRLPYINPNSWRMADGSAISPCLSCNVAIVKRSATSGAGTWDFTGTAGTFSSTIPEYRDYFDAGDITTKTLSSFSPFTFGFSYNVILPLQLMSFTGKLQNNDAHLNWSVNDAKELMSFDVEYSRDGRKFDRLTSIQPTVDLQYDFIHSRPLAGTHFYRLLIREKSGRSFYSNVVLLTIGNAKTQIIGLRENPVSEAPVVKITSAKTQQMIMRLFDVSGKLLAEESTNLVPGYNEKMMNNRMLMSGIYIIQILTDDRSNATIRYLKR